jgi:rod shape-determining protein MreD
MFAIFWSRLDPFLRRLIPLLTTALALLCNLTPWPLPHFGDIAPPFVLMAVYYWSIHRPDLLGALPCFLIGLFLDFAFGVPLGLHALLFVVVHGLLISQRRFFVGHAFVMSWVGFAGVAVMSALLSYGGISLFGDGDIKLIPLLLQAVMAILVFPLPAWFFISVQRKFLTNV